MDERQGQWISQAAAGDAAAFESLYNLHAGRIKAYLLRSGFVAADADDLTQEVFLRVFASLPTFDPARGTFPAWLAAVARNVVRRAFNRRGDARNFDPQLAEQTLAVEGNPGRFAGEGEEHAALAGCIESLPPELGRLVRLRYVEARTTRGVAEAAGMPESTVRLRLGEALAALEKCLRSKGVTE